MNAPVLPPFGVIQAALRKTTEHLAHELHAPSAAAPDWDEFEWNIARAVAAMHGISTLLANRLRWRGAPAFRDFLQQQRDLSLQRDSRITRLLGEVDTALRSASLGAVGLKGTALRALEVYLPGERPMGDVDLLVAPGARPAAASALADIGYRQVLETWRDTVFEPARHAQGSGFGEHPDHPIKIEVHEHIAEFLPASVVEITGAVLPDKLPPGIAAYPTAGSLMIHLLLHCAGNMRAHALRALQLLDIALLAARMSESDWRLVRTWWVYPPLALTARYFPGSIPEKELVRAAASCPVYLRRSADRWSLGDVSWSNLRMHALPGLVWARTPLEAARFAAGRVWPNRDVRAEIAHGAKSQPMLAQLPWYELSHTQRLLRWLVARPPRVQTMTTITSIWKSPGTS